MVRATGCRYGGQRPSENRRGVKGCLRLRHVPPEAARRNRILSSLRPFGWTTAVPLRESRQPPHIIGGEFEANRPTIFADLRSAGKMGDCGDDVWILCPDSCPPMCYPFELEPQPLIPSGRYSVSRTRNRAVELLGAQQ